MAWHAENLNGFQHANKRFSHRKSRQRNMGLLSSLVLAHLQHASLTVTHRQIATIGVKNYQELDDFTKSCPPVHQTAQLLYERTDDYRAYRLSAAHIVTVTWSLPTSRRSSKNLPSNGNWQPWPERPSIGPGLFNYYQTGMRRKLHSWKGCNVGRATACCRPRCLISQRPHDPKRGY